MSSRRVDLRRIGGRLGRRIGRQAPGRRRRQASPCLPARRPKASRHPFGPASGRSRGQARRGQGARDPASRQRPPPLRAFPVAWIGCRLRSVGRNLDLVRLHRSKRIARSRCARQLLHRQRCSGSLAAGRKRVRVVRHDVDEERRRRIRPGRYRGPFQERKSADEYRVPPPKSARRRERCAASRGWPAVRNRQPALALLQSPRHHRRWSTVGEALQASRAARRIAPAPDGGRMSRLSCRFAVMLACVFATPALPRTRLPP